MKNYLSFLLEKEILKESTVLENGSSYQLYTTTKKGIDLLENIEKVLTHLD